MGHAPSGQAHRDEHRPKGTNHREPLFVLLPVWNEAVVIKKKLKPNSPSKNPNPFGGGDPPLPITRSAWLRTGSQARFRFESHEVLKMPVRKGKTAAVVKALEHIGQRRDETICMTDADALLGGRPPPNDAVVAINDRAVVLCPTANKPGWKNASTGRVGTVCGWRSPWSTVHRSSVPAYDGSPPPTAIDGDVGSTLTMHRLQRPYARVAGEPSWIPGRDLLMQRLPQLRNRDAKKFEGLRGCSGC